MYKLSILICTLDTRISEGYTKRINDILLRQKRKDVQVLMLGDNKSMTVGEKRNWLLKMAKGKYVTFIDDDDIVSGDYIMTLLELIDSNPDVVNFGVMIKYNSDKPKNVYYSIKNKTDQNYDKYYLRIPNHLMCFKRELALSVGFEEINFGEDNIFAKKILKKIKTEKCTNKVLYYYIYNRKKSQAK